MKYRGDLRLCTDLDMIDMRNYGKMWDLKNKKNLNSKKGKVSLNHGIFVKQAEQKKEKKIELICTCMKNA